MAQQAASAGSSSRSYKLQALQLRKAAAPEEAARSRQHKAEDRSDLVRSHGAVQLGHGAAASRGCGGCRPRQRALAAADSAVARSTQPRRRPELQMAQLTEMMKVMTHHLQEVKAQVSKLQQDPDLSFCFTPFIPYDTDDEE